MKREEFKKYVHWFDEYVESYIQKDSSLEENMRIKQIHSKNVCYHIKQIGESINLNDDELGLAEFIGLFHDVGRFEQYYKYKTFSDSKSQNHGELGVKVLSEYSIFNELEKTEINIIKSAILNHSIAKIPDAISDKELLFSRLIRDADKLDIWRLVIEYYYTSKPGENQTIELELPNEPRVSQKVKDAVLNKQIVLKEDMQTLNDFKIMQAGWIFDLNFKYSVDYVKKEGFINKILDSLHDTKEIYSLKEKIMEEIKV